MPPNPVIGDEFFVQNIGPDVTGVQANFEQRISISEIICGSADSISNLTRK